MLHISLISQDDVINLDKSRFNSNNHWLDNIAPIDYKEKIEQTHTSHWIDSFRQHHYDTITIDDPAVIKWMKECATISMQTGIFSELYREELDEYIEHISDTYADIFNGTGYFVRTENVSFKYGQHKIGPYYSFDQIIESMVSCSQGHTPINNRTTSITIYLLPWVDILPYNEFRVFVYNKQITAISQQHLHNKYPILYNTSYLREKCKIICDYFESTVKQSITHMDSYVYDFACVGYTCDEPFFIEPSTFGKEYAAGSALFHWLIDYDILYGNKLETDGIHVRYTRGHN